MYNAKANSKIFSQGLRTSNEGINHLKNWADGADKIC